MIEPVCGMNVDPNAGAGKLEHRGETYYFCGTGCAQKFQADPERFLRPPATTPLSRAAEYTCPMHPEIVRSGPGACPICGMALEPRVATAQERNPDLATITPPFLISLSLPPPPLPFM